MPSPSFLPLSALQHFLFCPRQTALIHLEQLWAENQFTMEGQLLHKKAHSEEHESRPGVRIIRSLPVSSETLKISGVCDIVEFSTSRPPTVTPIEYKRGRPKAHQADEVQVCAQAICLEEMLQTQIDIAYLFYGKRKRRMEVSLDESLRNLTRQTAANLHFLIENRDTPTSEYESKKCDSCSLFEKCQPKAMRLKKGIHSWFESQLEQSLEHDLST